MLAAVQWFFKQPVWLRIGWCLESSLSGIARVVRNRLHGSGHHEKGPNVKRFNSSQSFGPKGHHEKGPNKKALIFNLGFIVFLTVRRRPRP